MKRRGAALACMLFPLGCGDVLLDLPVPGDGGAADADAALAPDAPDASNVPCDTSTDCPSPISKCDTQTHLCVECLSSDDCGGNTPHCNLTTHACFSCVVDSDCDPNMACNKAIPRCASKCTNGTECGGLLCDLTYGYCVQCLHDSDCTSPATRCLLPQRYCVP